MTIEVITEFLRLSTVRVRASIYDDDGDLVDPDSVTIDIYDAEGTKQVDGTTMLNPSKGIYEYYYQTETGSAEGRWRGVVWATDGTYVSEGSFGFRVKV